MYSKRNQNDGKMSGCLKIGGERYGVWGRQREKDWKDFKEKRAKFWEWWIFLLLIVVMVSWVCTYVKAYQIIYFKYVVYYMSIILQQNCLNKQQKICSGSCSLTQNGIPQLPILSTWYSMKKNSLKTSDF